MEGYLSKQLEQLVGLFSWEECGGLRTLPMEQITSILDLGLMSFSLISAFFLIVEYAAVRS